MIGDRASSGARRPDSINKPETQHKTMAAMDVESAVKTVAARTWAPNSWRNYECLQMATYEDDAAAYEAVTSKLSKVPPLVQASEALRILLDTSTMEPAEQNAFLHND